MNILAHLYLSGDCNELKIGNFIADAVKGRLYTKYSPKIQKGIILHRAIDSFTDNHEIVLESKARLRSCYGKHSGIVVDIFYDHFLTLEWHKFSGTDVSVFIKDCYHLIIQNFLVLPGRVQKYFPFMVVNNWLGKYSHYKGIERVLNGMSKHSSLPLSTSQAMKIFSDQYESFRSEFNSFFPQLIEMTKNDFGVQFN